VVVNVPDGRVLLVNNRREGWTWPKGLIDRGEGPIFAAMREIQEEAGVLVEPVGRIAEIQTRRALRHYYLFWKISDGLPLSAETLGVRWVSLRKAKRLIQRERDREVLRAARRLLRRLDDN